jgi:cellulose synthase (UDP-forming)
LIVNRGAALAGHKRKPASEFAGFRTASGILVLLGVAMIAATPTTDGVQVKLAAVTVAVLMVMAWLKPMGGPFRLFTLLLIVFTSTRYMIWRGVETIPHDSPVTLIGGLMLFGAEGYGYVLLLLSAFLSVDIFRRRPKPAPLSPEKSPSVDILVPSYNEDEDLLEVTITAALNVSYAPGKAKVYLLDDGGTVAKRNQADPAKAAEALERHERLRALCDRLGATYLTREKNEHAKAGNINSALQHTDGDLILILDADHVPSADILWRTVGYFVDDPKLFLVQTPHFFLNPDPLERNLGTFRKMPSENEMFYSVIQLGLDSVNASFFCGSAAVLRREHIMEIGGISGDTITEDAETALELHSRGYRSAYVARPMVAGLAPETFSGFIVQRMRWAQGMVQIFLLKNPLVKKGLSLAQRIGYLNSCFYWFFPLARMIFILGPLLYLLFGVRVYVGDFDDFLMYGAPHIVGSLMLSATLYGRTRWAIASELYEIIQTIHCSGAILQVLKNPRAPEFAVTPKGESLESEFVSPLAKPFYWLIGIVFLGECAGLIRLLVDPIGPGVVGVLLLWNSFHFFLLIAALGVLYERPQRRIFPRFEREGAVHLDFIGKGVTARLTDISITGLGCVLPAGSDCNPEPGDRVRLDAVDLGMAHSQQIDLRVEKVFGTSEARRLGFSYVIEDPLQWQTIVALVYARSQNWKTFQEERATSEGMVLKVIFLMRDSLHHAMAHIRYLRRERNT